MTLPRKNTVVTCVAGTLYGLLYLLAGWMVSDMSSGLPSNQLIEGLAIVVFMPFALLLYQRMVHTYVITPLAAGRVQADFYRYEHFTYLVFLISAGFPAGLQPSIPLTMALGSVLVLTHIGLFWFVLDHEKRVSLVNSEKYIALLFLVSGFSALIYQVVWQRTLFTTFGINSESVTVVVSVFMFGLGVGALAGGFLQGKYPRHLLQLFLFLEISIGLFGLVSLPLIHLVGDMAGTTDTRTLVLLVYSILAIPTLLMGATLPVLVAYLQGYFYNIGRTVGLLYAFNTIGSAIAAFFTVQVLFVFFGQQSAIYIAAICNFVTALLIFDASRKLSRTNQGNSQVVPPQVTSDAERLPYAFVFTVLLAIGYISLSQEILWYRLLGYMTASRPQVFGLLLAAFLVGIAWGSLRSKQVCESTREAYDYLFRALLITALVFYFSIPAITQVTGYLGKHAGTIAAYLSIGAVAFFSGGILPTLIHLAVKNRQTRSSHAVSWLYFANIIGATLGPLLTGFVLLERYSFEQNILLLTGLTIALLLLILLFIPKNSGYKLRAAGVMASIILAAFGAHHVLYRNHLEVLQHASIDEAKPFKHKLENRSGIITVQTNAQSDIMYGHGIYDGQFNTDPVINTNHIDRAYMLAALHRQPKKVLEIGLSTGSWSKVISDYAPLQELTIVEINKGYPSLIEHYPDIASVLKNPKVKLFIDDGRRWLRNHPDEKFDFILMNTTYHWRSNVTNLLSKEFLALCKQHLNPGGVLYYNTTGSEDVIFTAAQVFKHVTTYSNFVAASDAPFDQTTAEKRHNLLHFKTADGSSIFDKDDRYRQVLKTLSSVGLKDVNEDFLAKKNLWLITDDNMAVEYKVQ